MSTTSLGVNLSNTVSIVGDSHAIAQAEGTHVDGILQCVRRKGYDAVRYFCRKLRTLIYG